MEKEKIKKVILDYIIEEFSDTSEIRKNHYSYCSFPGEDCICRSSDEINYDTELIQNGYITSFDIQEIIVFLENKFQLKFPTIDLFPKNFSTIDKITNLIIKYNK